MCCLFQSAHQCFLFLYFFISCALINCHFACSLMMIHSVCVLLLVRFSFGGSSIQTCIVLLRAEILTSIRLCTFSHFSRESVVSPVSLLLSSGRANNETARARHAKFDIIAYLRETEREKRAVSIQKAKAKRLNGERKPESGDLFVLIYFLFLLKIGRPSCICDYVSIQSSSKRIPEPDDDDKRTGPNFNSHLPELVIIRTLSGIDESACERFSPHAMIQRRTDAAHRQPLTHRTAPTARLMASKCIFMRCFKLKIPDIGAN